MTLSLCQHAACNFSKDPTFAIYLFQFIVIIGTVVLLPILAKFHKKLFKRYLIMMLGVFIFEFFTQPLWNNYDMSSWAYVYFDVSWVLTLGWTGLIMIAILITDYLFKKLKEKFKFFVYVGLASIFGFLAESWVLAIDLRSYAPEVKNILLNISVPVLNIPIEAFYYIPVFMALIIGFYKYWELYLFDKLIVPVKKDKWFRNIIIAVIGVFLYELMIEPMVINANLPQWSYIYQDISFLVTGGWVLLIYLSTFIVDYFLVGANLVKKFVAYLITLTAITLPIENFLVLTGIRQYGESLTNSFLGPVVPGTVLSFEVMFAIPLYLALVIAFVRYWSIIYDNNY